MYTQLYTHDPNIFYTIADSNLPCMRMLFYCVFVSSIQALADMVLLHYLFSTSDS